MRILLLNYEFPPIGGGAATASSQIAMHMARRGVEVAVLTAHFKGLDRVERRDGYIIYRVPALRRNVDRCSVPEMGGYIAGAAVPALRLANRFKPDVMHVFFGMPTGPVGLLVNQLKGIPYLLSLRGGDVPGFMGKELARMHGLTMPLTRLIWSRASKIVANSEGLRQLAVRTAPDRAIEIVPNGIDMGLFRPNEGPVEPDGKVRILFVGRLANQKGLTYLMHSLALLSPDTLRRVEVELVGSGPEESRLRSLARELGIEGIVHFLGWVPRTDIVSHYQNANIFVLPSLDEGLPNVVLEAMACGNAIVATDIAGNRELIQDGVNGLLVPPANKQALGRALEKVITDRTLRAKMGRSSRMLVSRYDWSCTADRYLALSQEIIASRAATSRPMTNDDRGN